MSEKSVPLKDIRTDGGTQMRAELTTDVYMDYRDKWLAGVEFDPVDVFHDGSTYWLADGFHRFYGAREAKRGSIPCRIHQGTQRDAILFACGANASHGLRRTNPDKRRSVEALLSDEEWCKWSDRKIAEQAAVSDMMVRDVRRQLQESCSSSPAAKAADQPRVGRDGKKRRPPVKKPEPIAPKKPAAKAEADPEPKAEQKQYKDSFDPKSFADTAPVAPAPVKPERSVFGKLRQLFDDMTSAERKSAAIMWEDWLGEEA